MISTLQVLARQTLRQRLACRAFSSLSHPTHLDNLGMFYSQTVNAPEMRLTSVFTGPTEPKLLDFTTSTVLREAARSHGDNVGLISSYQGVQLNYAQLERQAENIARGLLALGVHKGERVAVSSVNCVEQLLLQYATSMVGAILVSINPAFKAAELAQALNSTTARFLVTGHPTLSDSDKNTKAQRDSLEVLDHMKRHDIPFLERVIVIGDLELPKGALAWDELEVAGTAGRFEQALHQREKGVKAKDPACIQFTSGTTGLPKGAVLSHYNVTNNGRLVGHHMRITDEDRICVPVPLFHCFGQVMGNLAAAAIAASVVYPAPCFDAAATLAAVEKHRATALYGVPTMFIRQLELENFKDYDLSSLRTGIMAGSPCPERIMRRVREEMHMKDITVCYGMTETSPVSFQSMPEDPVERRVTTVGRLHPHLEAKVIDPTSESASASPLPIGSSGELCIKGYSTFLGYWQNPQATAKTMDAETGWLRTGDLAVLDTEGFCSIVGRTKDTVIRAGENIAVREVEELLLHHPAVVEAQCFGVPDESRGEELCAWIVLRSNGDGSMTTEDEIRDWATERIARFKVPRYIQFKQHSMIPFTQSGKPKKFLMTKQAAMDLGLDEHERIPLKESV